MTGVNEGHGEGVKIALGVETTVGGGAIIISGKGVSAFNVGEIVRVNVGSIFGSVWLIIGVGGGNVVDVRIEL